MNKQELLADFTGASRDAYVTSYERLLSGRLLPPGFEDKPITALTFTFSRESMGLNDEGDVTDFRESLSIGVVSPEMLEANFEFHPEMERYPDDIKVKRRATAEKLSEVVLGRSLAIGTVVSMDSVYADYMATTPEFHRVCMGTFQDGSKKKDILMGKNFAELARTYTKSNLITLPVPARRLISSLGIENESEANAVGLSLEEVEVLHMNHGFSFNMEVDLPLNGYEPEGFLLAYMARMQERLERMATNIERLRETPNSKFLIDARKEVYQDVAMAIQRAKQALDKSKLY